MALPPRSVPLARYMPSEAPLAAAERFRTAMSLRRSVRFFSPQAVDEALIRSIVATAATAPSGANKQPWRFVCVRDADTKRAIRQAAEQEEREFYERRASTEWLSDIQPMGTDPNKEFLEVAPWLIVMFKLTRTDPDETGAQGKVYYPDESVGIAAGMLITAIHMAGLVTLTHTPSPMGFLAKILQRPTHERAFLLLPVGWPAPECPVPDITRKPLDEVMKVV